MITIVYHSNPNQPKDCNHWGRFAKLTEQDHKDFEDSQEDEAITFWLECSHPITKLTEIPTKKLDKGILGEVQKIYTEDEDAIANAEIEEYLTAQKNMYELVDDVNFEDL